MGIIAFLILGLIAGAIAKLIWRGEQPGGLLGTLAVGIIGAVLGGLIASAVGIGSLTSFFSLGTWLIAIGGGLLFLVLWSALVSATRGSGRARTRR